MIKIYTSYFSKRESIILKEKNPCFLSIAKFALPPLLKKLDGSINEFKPSINLLNKYKMEKVTEEEYKVIYLEELKKNLGDKNIIELLSQYDKNNSALFLMCFEKSENFCHRHILREYLNTTCNLGIEEY